MRASHLSRLCGGGPGRGRSLLPAGLFWRCVKRTPGVSAGVQWSFINNSLQSHNYSRSARGGGGGSSLDRIYSRKIRKQLVHHKQVALPCAAHWSRLPRTLSLLASTLQQLNLLKAKQKALVEQMEKEKIQSNKGSSYKLLMEQAKLKQATSKVSGAPFQLLLFFLLTRRPFKGRLRNSRNGRERQKRRLKLPV